MILTVRRTRDGGSFAGERAGEGRAAGEARAGGIRLCRPGGGPGRAGLDARIAGSGARVIRSCTTSSGVPADLARRVARLARGPTEIPKAAVMPKSTADLGRLLDLQRGLGGEDPSRHGGLRISHAGPRLPLGSFLCYASPAGARSPRARWTRTPWITCTGSAASVRRPPCTASSAILSCIPAPRSSTTAASRHWARCRLPSFPRATTWTASGKSRMPSASRALSVTVPHKQAVIGRLSEATRSCRPPGPATPDARRQGEPWQGTNTDVAGFLAPLRELFGGVIPRGPRRHGDRRRRRGARGGLRPGRPAVRACWCSIAPRTAAGELAGTSPRACRGLDEAGYAGARDYADLIVQTTSVGHGARRRGADPGARARISAGRRSSTSLSMRRPSPPLLRRARRCRLQGRAREADAACPGNGAVSAVYGSISSRRAAELGKREIENFFTIYVLTLFSCPRIIMQPLQSVHREEDNAA